jgi:hypothetical protein
VTGFFLFEASALEKNVRAREPTTFPRVGALSVFEIMEKKIHPMAPEIPQYKSSARGAENTMANAIVATMLTTNSII